MHYITNPFFVYLLNDIKVQKKPFLIRLIKSYGTRGRTRTDTSELVGF